MHGYDGMQFILINKVSTVIDQADITILDVAGSLSIVSIRG
jgi:hypothetical protein